MEKNNQPNFSVNQNLEIILPKKEKAYPISKDKWMAIKEKIRRIGNPTNLYQSFAFLFFGISGSAFISLFVANFPNNKDGPVSAIFVGFIIFTIATLGFGFLLLHFSKRDQKNRNVTVDDIIEEMEFIERQFSEKGIDQEEGRDEIYNPSDDKIGKFEIIEAHFETKNNSFDVTKNLINQIKNNELNIKASREIFGDPESGVKKTLRIKYRVNNEEHEKIYQEGQIIQLP